MKQLKANQLFNDTEEIIKLLCKGTSNKIRDNVYKSTDSICCIILRNINDYDFEEIPKSIYDKWFLVFEVQKNKDLMFKGLYRIEESDNRQKFKLISSIWNC